MYFNLSWVHLQKFYVTLTNLHQQLLKDRHLEVEKDSILHCMKFDISTDLQTLRDQKYLGTKYIYPFFFLQVITRH